MELTLLLAIAAPILIALVVKFVFHETITITESLTQVLLVTAIIFGFWGLGRYSDTGDTELWNGEVTNKEIIRRNCPWGWNDYTDSFCTEYTTRRVKDGPPRRVCSGDGKDRRCHMEQDYKTQYRYDYPWEQKFYVYTNVQETFHIARVDPQGALTPPAYTRSFVGDPVAVPKRYTNWIKGAAYSIFHEDGAAEEKYVKMLPQYPMEIYEIYKVDRVVRVGDVTVPGFVTDALRADLKELGPQQQMNVIIVVADAKVVGQDFPYAVRRYWQGFKKNDAVVFLGVDGAVLKWVDVMSWSKKSMFNVSLRNHLADFTDKPLDYMRVLSYITIDAQAHYERRSMKEFEYLKSQIPVPTWLTITIFVLGLVGSAGLTWLFHSVKFDPIGTILNYRRFR